MADFFHAFALATDQNARLGGVNGYADLSRKAFYFYAGDTSLTVLDGIRQLLAKNSHIRILHRTTFGRGSHQQTADRKILMQLLAVLRTFGEPATLPTLVNAKAHANWMNFTTHNFSLFPGYEPRSRKT